MSSTDQLCGRGDGPRAAPRRPAASYVWDYPNAGAPTAPVAPALKAIGVAPPMPPSPQATAMTALETLWREAGFGAIATRTITIPVAFQSFEEFWDSMTQPVGPGGKAIAQLSPAERERLRAVLRERVPPGPDGRIVYEARANAIKGVKA